VVLAEQQNVVVGRPVGPQTNPGRGRLVRPLNPAVVTANNGQRVGQSSLRNGERPNLRRPAVRPNLEPQAVPQFVAPPAVAPATAALV